jgi:hypothetical protein
MKNIPMPAAGKHSLKKHRCFNSFWEIVLMGLWTAVNAHKTASNYNILVGKPDLRDHL